MKGPLSWLANFAEWCGICLLVAVGLPLFAVAVIMLRGVLLIASLAGLLAASIAFLAVPRFRHWTLHNPRRPHLHVLL